MKAFGVRLAAGVATILFGAYAAALAQKDKQNDSSAWTAQPPSLGEPAAPIAGISEDTWISQPESASSNSLADFAAGAFNQSPVALVQHTEEAGQNDLRSNDSSFDVSSLPASLGEPQSDNISDASMAMEVPDWTMDASAAPPQDLPGQESFSDSQPQTEEQSLSMNFPSEMPNQEPAFNQDAAFGQDPAFGQEADLPAQPMQNLELAQAPAMDMYPEPSQSPSNDLRQSPIQNSPRFADSRFVGTGSPVQYASRSTSRLCSEPTATATSLCDGIAGHAAARSAPSKSAPTTSAFGQSSTPRSRNHGTRGWRRTSRRLSIDASAAKHGRRCPVQRNG